MREGNDVLSSSGQVQAGEGKIAVRQSTAGLTPGEAKPVSV